LPAELVWRFGKPAIGFNPTYRQVRVTSAFDFKSHTLASHCRSQRMEHLADLASVALTVDESADKGVPQNGDQRPGNNEGDQNIAASLVVSRHLRVTVRPQHPHGGRNLDRLAAPSRRINRGRYSGCCKVSTIHTGSLALMIQGSSALMSS
jgi:hypothetical protein